MRRASPISQSPCIASRAHCTRVSRAPTWSVLESVLPCELKTAVSRGCEADHGKVVPRGRARRHPHDGSTATEHLDSFIDRLFSCQRIDALDLCPYPFNDPRSQPTSCSPSSVKQASELYRNDASRNRGRSSRLRRSFRVLVLQAWASEGAASQRAGHRRRGREPPGFFPKAASSSSTSACFGVSAWSGWFAMWCSSDNLLSVTWVRVGG